MSSFYAISPPPQTLESTGEWGDLDSLLWSLDDPRWLTIGVYGIRVTEAARTTQAATLFKRIRLFSGITRATAKETGSISVIMFPKGEATAVCSEHVSVVRGLSLAGITFAMSGEEGTVFRIRPISGSAYAQATETEGPRRVRLLAAPAYAVSSVNSLLLLRARCTSGEVVANTSETAIPSIKGHNWKDEARERRDWKTLHDETEWGWIPISGAHPTKWRGIVQWP
jgi:hypothetical protein|nr:MAG TPA: hypothetical protein [Caudoviricetes sp.]